MKILHIINTLAGGGRERRMIQLLIGLSQFKEYELTLISFDGNRVDYPQIYNTNVDLHLLKDLTRKQKRKYVSETILRVCPDIVHLWGGDFRMMPEYIKLRHRLHFKLIEGGVADGIVDPVTSKSFWANKISFFFCDLIISNSLAGLKAKGAPKEKSRVVVNGFDYARFANVVNSEALREELQIPTGHKIVAMIARISEAKDWDSFISLAKLAQEDNQNITFIAVGKGEKLDYYCDLIEKEKFSNIKFVGFRNDVEDIIRISFATVLFSNASVHAEGISNSIMESLAAGVPVIATNGGGTNEIILDDEDGYIVSPRDYQKAYECLKRLLSNNSLYKRFCDKAVSDIKERFLLSTMVDNYRNIYNQLVKGN